MIKIRYGFQIGLSVTQVTPLLARLDIHPDRRGDIVTETVFTVSGFPVTPAFSGIHGNLCRWITVNPGNALLECSGIIQDSGIFEPALSNQPAVPVTALPYDTLIYLPASRYCETDLLMNEAWSRFGNLPEGAARVRAVVDYAHSHHKFSYALARETRSAREALSERVAVCRDFSHVVITFCRCLNIPARYVNGYLGDIGVPPDPAPMDFSAWAEVYLDGRWYTVDARHNQPRVGRIVIARGRDAADVPMVHTFGPHSLTTFKVVTEEISEGSS